MCFKGNLLTHRCNVSCVYFLLDRKFLESERVQFLIGSPPPPPLETLAYWPGF